MAKKDNEALTLEKHPCCHLQLSPSTEEGEQSLLAHKLSHPDSTPATVSDCWDHRLQQGRETEGLSSFSVTRWGILLVPLPPSCFVVCVPHCPFGSYLPRGESSPRRYVLHPEPNMLPKSVKIKRSLSQSGQEPSWKRAKANEDPPSLSSVATSPREQSLRLPWGHFVHLCRRAWALFSRCAARGVPRHHCWCLLRQNRGCNLLLGFPSNGKTQPQPGCCVQAPICPCPLPNF